MLTPTRLATALILALLSLALAGAAAPPPPPATLDSDGEPLPRHAIARLGSRRLFHRADLALSFSPDGSVLASTAQHGTRLWDVKTGLELTLPAKIANRTTFLDGAPPLPALPPVRPNDPRSRFVLRRAEVI